MDTLKLELKKMIIATLDLEDTTPGDIGDELALFAADGLGLDSIDALELGVALRRKYGIQLEAGDTGNKAHFRSVETLARLVQNQTANTK